jgi:hypothetical protein
LLTRDEAVAARGSETSIRYSWEATVKRAEAALATLGTHRPVTVIQAEIGATAIAPHILRRTRQCTDLTLSESRLACAPLLALQKELAAAEAAERLETRVVTGRTELAAAPVAGLVADPHAGALARITGFDEATIRVAVALLLATLVEMGSALGFTLVAAATSANPTQKQGTHAAGLANVACQTAPIARAQVAGAAFERWVETQLKWNSSAEIAARAAYAEFCRWSRAAGLTPCSETRFGRDLTERITRLGGGKQKRRDRTYYRGFAVIASVNPERSVRTPSVPLAARTRDTQPRTAIWRQPASDRSVASAHELDAD